MAKQSESSVLIGDGEHKVITLIEFFYAIILFLCIMLLTGGVIIIFGFMIESLFGIKIFR